MDGYLWIYFAFILTFFYSRCMGWNNFFCYFVVFLYIISFTAVSLLPLLIRLCVLLLLLLLLVVVFFCWCLCWFTSCFSLYDWDHLHVLVDCCASFLFFLLYYVLVVVFCLFSSIFFSSNKKSQKSNQILSYLPNFFINTLIYHTIFTHLPFLPFISKRIR